MTTKQLPEKPERGDRVSIYQTIYYNIHGKSGGATTCFCAHGVVLRVYKHIRAMVVRIHQERVFIKDNDPQWSVYSEEVKG